MSAGSSLWSFENPLGCPVPLETIPTWLCPRIPRASISKMVFSVTVLQMEQCRCAAMLLSRRSWPEQGGGTGPMMLPSTTRGPARGEHLPHQRRAVQGGEACSGLPCPGWRWAPKLGNGDAAHPSCDPGSAGGSRTGCSRTLCVRKRATAGLLCLF